MPQPVGNGAQINAGLEQMDSRAVTETVWVDTPPEFGAGRSADPPPGDDTLR
jgi:hypothetical protein